jgi:hypothetical protein
VFLCFILASAKTLSGLLEWECKTDAVEALTALNHYQIRVPSKYNDLCVCVIVESGLWKAKENWTQARQDAS